MRNRYLMVIRPTTGMIGYTGNKLYLCHISKGRGVGIWRRKLSCNRGKEYTQRVKELDRAGENHTTLWFPTDAQAIQYAEETEEYLNE